jgi:hypothetical protein
VKRTTHKRCEKRSQTPVSLLVKLSQRNASEVMFSTGSFWYFSKREGPIRDLHGRVINGPAIHDLSSAYRGQASNIFQSMTPARGSSLERRTAGHRVGLLTRHATKTNVVPDRPMVPERMIFTTRPFPSSCRRLSPLRKILRQSRVRPGSCRDNHFQSRLQLQECHPSF